MFLVGGWIHCGEVDNGMFKAVGRKVSVNFQMKEAIFSNTKQTKDGLLQAKIYKFTEKSAGRDLLINGLK